MSVGTVTHGIHINTYTSILLKNKNILKISVGEDRDKGNYYILLVRNILKSLWRFLKLKDLLYDLVLTPLDIYPRDS